MGLKVTLVAFVALQFVYKESQKLAVSFPTSDTNGANDNGKTQDGENTTLHNRVSIFDNRVGGHEGMLEDDEGYILKPGHHREVDFYDTLTKTEDPQLQQLKQFVPRYAGKVRYLRIEDIAKDFVYPCIMDVKIGKITWEPTVDEKKIAGQLLKYPEMRERFQFGIMGYQYYDMRDNKEFVKYGGKAFGNKMKAAEGIEAMYKLVNGELGIRAGLVDAILTQLRKIASWFEKQKSYNFFGSSILLSYDAKSLEGGDRVRADSSAVRVRLIDFSHATPSKTKDENNANAIEKLINLLENLENLYAKEVQGKIHRDTEKTEKKATHSHQLGGHPGMMKDPKGYVLKPELDLKETEFYEVLRNTQDSELLELKQFTPKYDGVAEFLRLEDLTEGFKTPSILDVKIGEQTWEPTASKAKKEERMSKSVELREQWKFSVPGFRYYDLADEKWVKEGKEFSYRMKPDDAVKVLYNYVNGKLGTESGLVDKILNRLKEINSWFEQPISYKFYGSSILFVYDAETLVTGKDPEVRVKMIDFSHAVPNEELIKDKDENYATGLKKLIEAFQNVTTFHEN